jgi:glyoxylase-like metal-dependent hydrolase (beta-lactamase superfamily II)
MNFPPLPAELAGHQPQGGVTNCPVAQFEIGAHKNFVYLILDWTERVAAWVDPQSDLTEPLAFLTKHKFRLGSILLTHTHFDHIAGVAELLHRFPESPLVVHQTDTHRLAKPALARVRPAGDGELLKIGSMSLKILHTPGHSAGECSYLLQTGRPYLFTGDTIFIRDCGRTDFEDGSNEQMFASIQRVKKLPPETIILPGHHYKPECATTIAREMEESGPFRCRSVEELAALP